MKRQPFKYFLVYRNPTLQCFDEKCG